MKKKIFLFLLIINILGPTIYTLYNVVFCNTAQETFMIELLKISEEESKEIEDSSEKEKNFILIQIVIPIQELNSGKNKFYFFDCKALPRHQQILSPPPKLA